MDDLNKTHDHGDPHAPAGEETPSKKITSSDDDDLAPAEMSPWQLPWKAISITIVLLILIAGAVHVVGLASNRIVRLSTASIRKHGAEPGEFRPMGGVLTEALPGSKKRQKTPNRINLRPSRSVELLGDSESGLSFIRTSR